ncbi:AmmeMemoRadiSam system protein B [candidate division KSB1 bacterium]|nr:AmmeMemoRadiSam system protein B [candidate division KSB1 bacterium]RQW04694.1 MAG: AmmeMemoRadiSam system protein B [candidate division KSB1 bacterium]
MKRDSQEIRKGSQWIHYPKIRPGIQPFRYQDRNKNLFVGLKDPLELSEAIILLPLDLYYLLQFCDGAHSLEDMLSCYTRRFGAVLPADRLHKMIKKMDDGLLFDNERSQKRIAQIEAAFRNQDIRAATCAGDSYAFERSALEKELQTYHDAGAVDKSILTRFEKKNIKAMILPHIDLRLGGATYAAAYDVLRRAQPIDLFVILGISHQPTTHAFVMTTKDFQTPLGLVKTDKTIVKNIMERCTTDFFADEIVHRDEHSIEFQTLFLRYHCTSDFRIVPILCSFSHLPSAANKKQIAEMTAALRAETDSYRGTVCFIASVDLSHIGPHYGDDFRPDSFMLAKVEQADKDVLDALAQHDMAKFEQYFIRSNNKYNICGYPALRTLMEILPPAHATLLHYDNAIMDDERSTVTFASMIFS